MQKNFAIFQSYRPALLVLGYGIDRAESVEDVVLYILFRTATPVREREEALCCRRWPLAVDVYGQLWLKGVMDTLVRHDANFA